MCHFVKTFFMLEDSYADVFLIKIVRNVTFIVQNWANNHGNANIFFTTKSWVVWFISPATQHFFLVVQQHLLFVGDHKKIIWRLFIKNKKKANRTTNCDEFNRGTLLCCCHTYMIFRMNVKDQDKCLTPTQASALYLDFDIWEKKIYYPKQSNQCITQELFFRLPSLKKYLSDWNIDSRRRSKNIDTTVDGISKLLCVNKNTSEKLFGK